MLNVYGEGHMFKQIDPPAHYIQAFEIGPSIFLDIRVWKDEHPGFYEVARGSHQGMLLIYYRDSRFDSIGM